MTNGGFDSSITGWAAYDTDITVSRVSLDSSGCASSGSLMVTWQGAVGAWSAGSGPCIPVSTSTTYNLGGWIYIPSGHNSGKARLTWGWYDASCQTITGSNWAEATVTYDVWQYVHLESITPPAGTGTMSMGAWASKAADGGPGAAYFDSVYITPVPGHF
jgi:hypothetical protein